MDEPRLSDPPAEQAAPAALEGPAVASMVQPTAVDSDSTEAAELYFLIANFLTNASPCSRAAAVLQEELRERNLLGTAYDWESNARPASFDDVRSRHRTLPADQLARVTSEYLRQAREVYDTAEGTTGGTSRDPVAARSLLSRVEPSGGDWEINAKRRAELGARVIEACVRALQVRCKSKKVASELAELRSKLKALLMEMDEEAAAAACGGDDVRVVTRRKRKVDVAGQESQAELTRLAYERRIEELSAKESQIPVEMGLAMDEKEASEREARRQHALRNSLTRYNAKAVPTILSNRNAGGRRFGGGLSAGGVQLRDMSARLLGERRKPLTTANGHGINPVYCIKFDQTGQFVFTGADDHLIKVWSTSSGRLMLSLRGHSSVITDLAVSPDNSLLVSSSEDRNLRVWDPRTGAGLAVLRGHDAPVNLVHFAPGDSVAMSASEDGTCRIWDLRDRDSLTTEAVVPIVLPHKNHQGGLIPVNCLSVSPAGNLIAAGCDDGAVRVWAYGDANDDAAWGSGKHNTRGTGRDRIGDGEVYRSVRQAPLPPPPLAPAPAADAAPVQDAGQAVFVLPDAAVLAATEERIASRIASRRPPGVPFAGGERRGLFSAGSAVRPASERGRQGLAQGSAAASSERGREGSTQVSAAGPGSRIFAGGPAGVGAGSTGNGTRAPANHVGSERASVVGDGDGTGRIGGSRGAGETGVEAREARTRGRPSEGGDANGAETPRKAGRMLEVRRATMLYGHVSGVTDTRFSGLGDRILTASMEDGTARVYSWGPRFSNVQHLVMKVCRQDVTAAAASGRGRGRGARAEKASLDDACWSSGDEIIVTTESRTPGPRVPEAESGSQFKVWDSRSGVLLHTVKRTHASAVLALIPHPFDSTCLASVGSDGRVCTWDVGAGRADCGRCTARFDNILAGGPQSEALQHGMAVNVLDGVFSPDGASLAVADLVPLEQYFTSDYRELIRDQFDNVVDAFTNLPPHLAQTGHLVDWIGNTYPEDCQPDKRDLFGPLPLPPGLVKQRLQAVAGIALDLRRALAANEARATARGFGLNLTNTAGRGSGRALPPNASMRNPARSTVKPENGSGGGGGRGAGGRGGGGAYGSRRSTATQRGFYTEPDEEDPSFEDADIYDFGDDPDSDYDYAPRRGRRSRGGRGNGHLSREERARRREQVLGGGASAGGGSRRGSGGRRAGGGAIVTVSSDDEEEDEEDDDEELMGEERRGRRKKKGKGKGKARNKRCNGAGTASLPVVPDKFATNIMAVGSDDEEGEPEYGRGNSRIARFNRRDLTCALCHEGDTADRPLPGTVVGVHPVMDGATPFWVHDGCALYSPMVCREESSDALCNITSEVKRGRLMTCKGCNKKGATIGCLVETCKASFHYPCAEETGWSFGSSPVGFHCPRCRGRLGSRPGGGGAAAGEGGDYWKNNEKRADREWLTTDSPEAAMHRYAPQVGEVVMYFPQGHIQYLKEFPENSSPPFKLFPKQPPVVRCQVKGISYAFPTDYEETKCLSVLCHITLRVTGFPFRISGAITSRQEMNAARAGSLPLAYREDSFQAPAPEDPSTTFTLTMRDAGIADFLIPERRYYDAVNLQWKPEQRVVMEWKEVPEGADDGDDEPAAVLTPFFGKVVQVARGQPDTAGSTWANSPWECLVVKWDQDPVTSLLGPWEPRLVTWGPGEDVHPFDTKRLREHISADTRDRLAASIAEITKSEDAEPFAQPVDVEDYHTIVPVPMDLGLILRRLENDYYCCVDALEFDCNLIYANCTKYNLPESNIVHLASLLVDQLVHVIKSVSDGGSGSGSGSGGGSSSAGGGSSSSGGGGSSSSGGGVPAGNGFLAHSNGGADNAEAAAVRTGSNGVLSSRARRGLGASVIVGGRRGAGVDWMRDEDDEQEDTNEEDREEEGGQEEDEDEGEDEDDKDVYRDASRRGKRKRAPTARYNSEDGGSGTGGASSLRIPSRGRGRSSSGPSASGGGSGSGNGSGGGGMAGEFSAPLREPKRRRASPVSFFYRDEDTALDDGDDNEEAEAEDVKGEPPGRRGGGGDRQAVSGTRGQGIRGRPANGLPWNHSHSAQPRSFAAQNGRVAAGPGRSSGSNQAEGSSGGGKGRAISPIIRQMLAHQGEALASHDESLDLVRQFAQEVWEEPAPPTEETLSAVGRVLLDMLRTIDAEGVFAAPVTENEAPGYIAAILRPMDFGTMEARLRKGEYRSAAELHDDVVLIVANCLTYNEPETTFAYSAISLMGQAGGAYCAALATVGEAGSGSRRGASTGPAVGGASAGGLAGGGAGASAGASAGPPPGAVVKRKRGRPRKHPIP